MTAGAGQDAVLAGKFVAVAGVGVCVALVVVAITTAAAVLSSDDGSALDTIVRGASIFVGFAAYACACAGVALFVSALARTATSALLILLTAWAVAIVVVPRVAASAGELLHPTPDGSTFWMDTAEAIQTDRPKRGSEALRQLEQQVISRATGREAAAGRGGARRI